MYLILKKYITLKPIIFFLVIFLVMIFCFAEQSNAQLFIFDSLAGTSWHPSPSIFVDPDDYVGGVIPPEFFTDISRQSDIIMPYGFGTSGGFGLYGGFGYGNPAYLSNGYQQQRYFHYNPFGYQEQSYNPYGYQQPYSPYSYQQPYNFYADPWIWEGESPPGWQPPSPPPWYTPIYSPHDFSFEYLFRPYYGG